MKNLHRCPPPSSQIPYTAGSNKINSGDVVEIKSGNTGNIGVAVDDIAANADGMVETEGQFELAAETGTSWSVWDDLYWDGSKLTKTASSYTYAGKAAAAKQSATDHGQVKLVPQRNA